ncbi:hypothetical protein BGZ83_012007 [Gryganskiella cystojenkinii]|nr:hypothetical protein BGZ83_012007 [Gryganskiella cystojenkinii]
MRYTLQDIEEFSATQLRIKHLHFAITEESKYLKNWTNALAIFNSYLAPVIIAAQKNSSSISTDEVTTVNAASLPSSSSVSPSPSLSSSDNKRDHDSSLVVDVLHGAAALIPNDVTFLQRAISVMVRYAPSPTEANVIYGFFLKQCQEPIRNDATIDTNLINLIYQYAQVKDDPEIQRQGLDLVRVALERGIGLSTYNARHSHTSNNPGSILASVSRPILLLHQLQITADGRSLEARTQQHQQQRQSHLHKKQHQLRPALASNSKPQQEEGQEQPPHHRQAGGPQSRNFVSEKSPQQDQATNRASPSSISSSRPETPTKDGRASNNGAPSREKKVLGNTADDDQYSYYLKTSRPSFEGAPRGARGGMRGGMRGRGGRGGSDRGGDRGSFSSYGISMGSPRREIKFVPASSNVMLNVDHHPNDEPYRSDAATLNPSTKVAASSSLLCNEDADLARGVEKMKLVAPTTAAGDQGSSVADPKK